MSHKHLAYEPGRYFSVGGDERERLEDGNWLSCEVSVHAGGFVGRFPASLRAEELQGFLDQARSLHRDLRGVARYESMEQQLELVLEGDGHGHVRCAGKAWDVAGLGNLLTFELQFDQTQPFRTMVELEEVANRYPVRGSPGG